MPIVGGRSLKMRRKKTTKKWFGISAWFQLAIRTSHSHLGYTARGNQLLFSLQIFAKTRCHLMSDHIVFGSKWGRVPVNGCRFLDYLFTTQYDHEKMRACRSTRLVPVVKNQDPVLLIGALQFFNTTPSAKASSRPDMRLFSFFVCCKRQFRTCSRLENLDCVVNKESYCVVNKESKKRQPFTRTRPCLLPNMI